MHAINSQFTPCGCEFPPRFLSASFNSNSNYDWELLASESGGESAA